MKVEQIPKRDMAEIIIAEYNYWNTHDNIDAMGACANILCAMMLYPETDSGRSANIVRKIRASKLPDDVLAVAFELTTQQIADIRKEPNGRTTQIPRE